MARWYPLKPCDESFLSTAPHVYRYAMDLPVPPERVWESLTSAHSVADWTPLLHSIEWTSELGLGATRTVVLPVRALSIHEYFFVWDEGRRFAFYGVEANRPLLHRFAEDYLVEPAGDGTRFTWTFALEGTRATAPLLKVMSPGTALAFRRMAYGAKGYFARKPQA
jgi:carbon monoxide dehydrogenase subunit G